MVSHTHETIDQAFSKIAQLLFRVNAITPIDFMAHMKRAWRKWGTTQCQEVTEVGDFATWREADTINVNDIREALCWRFQKNSQDEVRLHYKDHGSDPYWLPREGLDIHETSPFLDAPVLVKPNIKPKGGSYIDYTAKAETLKNLSLNQKMTPAQFDTWIAWIEQKKSLISDFVPNTPLTSWTKLREYGLNLKNVGKGKRPADPVELELTPLDKRRKMTPYNGPYRPPERTVKETLEVGKMVVIYKLNSLKATVGLVTKCNTYFVWVDYWHNVNQNVKGIYRPCTKGTKEPGFKDKVTPADVVMVFNFNKNNRLPHKAIVKIEECSELPNSEDSSENSGNENSGNESE
eukprot:Lithocolla_globosa_v1_NODE_1735_length_2372_cov_21.738455.p1 type:complete len:348 gc:universal NODE_1735_length_2372_cov_21.738455:784-1827(+)